MKNKLTIYIFLGLISGVIVGYLLHFGVNNDNRNEITSNLMLIATVFLRLIKMIIAPLVITTLIVGIAKMGDIQSIGRIGIRSLSWFIFASIISLALGLIMVNLIRPGDGISHLINGLAHNSSSVQHSSLSIKDFITHAVPISIIEGMSKNEILQIVIFSLFFGIGASALGNQAEPLIKILEIIAFSMLNVTKYIMYFAPLAVFAAVTAMIANNGLNILTNYAKFMLGFYFSIGILWFVLISITFLILGKSVISLIRLIRAPIILAFSTASSEAAYPSTLQQLEKFGVPNRIASFVLPIGYSFNLDGSMMYCTFASIFIAQAYGIELSFVQQISMLLILMITSKGMAGVPRASLVVIAVTLNQFNIPEEGLILLFGIDHFLDMARSATNVLGNCIASAIVSKYESSRKILLK